jgi:hypothetical protein
MTAVRERETKRAARQVQTEWTVRAMVLRTERVMEARQTTAAMGAKQMTAAMVVRVRDKSHSTMIFFEILVPS